MIATVTLALVLLLILRAAPAHANHAHDVTSVDGHAYGHYGSTSLFGGAPLTHEPSPKVTLPASGGSASASAETGAVQHGPATFFTSGPLTVRTRGTTGVGGSVASSSTIEEVNTSGQEPFTATGVSSSCTASGSGTSGSTTVAGGTLKTSEGDPNIEGDETFVSIPRTPAPNTTYSGTNAVGDAFQYTFNKQLTATGSVVVFAAHLRLLGPIAIGDVYIGRSACGVASTPVTDHEPPETTITNKKVKHAKRRARFWFVSSESGSTFECRLDGRPFKPCSSPKTYRRLKPGSHTFRVRAIDAALNRDQTPAVAKFKIKKQ